MKLSEEEVKKRLIRLTNLERLYPIARARINSLKKEVHELKTMVASQQKTIDDLKLQMEELKKIVFSMRRPSHKYPDSDGQNPRKEKIPRSVDSYKRSVPSEDEVTETKYHSLDICECGVQITKKKTSIFFEEDIPIPTQKIVRKHIVEKSWCARCKKWQTAIPLPCAKVVLGSNIQKYICYLSILCRLSFTQIQNILYDTYCIDVSQGEITKILSREAQKLLPHYEQLKEKIRGEPVIHLDETSWRIFIDPDSSFSWVMSGGQSQESVFLIGENRGHGNADHLIGSHDGFVVTDDYGAYRKLKNHQLCWAHLLRKFRDLANSKELSEAEHAHCIQEYQTLCKIYADVKNNCILENYATFSRRLTQFSNIDSLDSKKAVRLKTTLVKNIPNYLTCLQDPRIPMTNNQAERSLRHLVLKRKISFGSLTKKTADNLAILLSVLMSLRQRHQGNFFGEYLRV